MGRSLNFLRRYWTPLLLISFIMRSIQSSAQGLQATAILMPNGGTTWNYTLSNLEPTSSDFWLTDFVLPINAPIRNVASPLGWLVDTDSQNYVRWSNVEPYPYPNDIAPGTSVSGFSFESDATDSVSAVFTLASWNHATDDAGPTTTGNVLAPFAPAPVPETSTLAGMAMLLAVGATARLRQRRLLAKSAR